MFPCSDYNPGDAALIGEFDQSLRLRKAAALERMWNRMEERGLMETLNFWLRKQVMTFNDGMFGWRGEVWIDEEYPQDVATNTLWTSRFRNVFWNGLEHEKEYNTLAQLAWLFFLFGIIGIGVSGWKARKENIIFIISFLGIFFYQMFFEARARYLFVFLPILLVMGVVGMQQFFVFYHKK